MLFIKNCSFLPNFGPLMLFQMEKLFLGPEQGFIKF